MPTRRASATWEGGLKGGTGSFRGESGAVDARYSFGSRFEEAGGTNPEELLAAAEAACFSMALAGALERNGTPSSRVQTDAACTIEKGESGFGITGIRLRTRVKADVDAETFQRIARETKEACPVSKALAAIEIELEAELE